MLIGGRRCESPRRWDVYSGAAGGSAAAIASSPLPGPVSESRRQSALRPEPVRGSGGGRRYRRTVRQVPQ